MLNFTVAIMTSFVMGFLFSLYVQAEPVLAVVITLCLFICSLYFALKDIRKLLSFFIVGLSIFVTLESLHISHMSVLVSSITSLIIGVAFSFSYDFLLRKVYFVKTLSLIYLVLWIILAFNVVSREDWILENIINVIVAGVLVFLVVKRGYKLSDYSYIGIFFFGFLELIGAHYTWSSVPFSQTVTDYFLFSRSYFDTFAHFTFGFVFFQPLREMYIAKVKDLSFISYLFPVAFIGLLSLLYEVIEWLTTYMTPPDVFYLFFAAQGDRWDTQKDMAAALLGSMIVAIAIAIYHFYKKHSSNNRHLMHN